MLVNIPFKGSVLLLIILEQCPQTAIASVQSTQQGPSSITGSLLGRESGGKSTLGARLQELQENKTRKSPRGFSPWCKLHMKKRNQNGASL